MTALLSRAGPAKMIIMRGTRALLVATLALLTARVEVRTEDQPHEVNEEHIKLSFLEPGLQQV